MIVDCYTYVWDTPARLGRAGLRSEGRSAALPHGPDGASPPYAGTEQHFAASAPVDTTIVLGFKSAYLDAEIPNDFVADYVREHPGRLIGFAGIDPADPNEAVRQMTSARNDLGMAGVAISPAAQNFHPCHTDAKTCYEAAESMQLPVLFHTGVRNARECVMQYGRPLLLDEVAREFPSLKIIIAHMGFPWVDETLVLLAKHPNVYSDVSWLVHQPWHAYQSLLTAHQYGVMHKLLFGSGFPYTDAASCIESLYGINHMVHGTSLPTIPREQLRGIVERDTLELLGLPRLNGSNGSHLKNKPLLDDED